MQTELHVTETVQNRRKLVILKNFKVIKSKNEQLFYPRFDLYIPFQKILYYFHKYHCIDESLTEEPTVYIYHIRQNYVSGPIIPSETSSIFFVIMIWPHIHKHGTTIKK